MFKQQELVDFEAFIKETQVDKEVVIELYEVFLDELSDEKDKIHTCLLSENYTHLQKVIHNIKGISGSYKVYKVFEIACSIDIDLKNGYITEIYKNIHELNDAIEISVQYIYSKLKTF